MPKTKTDNTTATVTVTNEVKQIIEAKRDELTGVFGFKPTQGQTLAHLLKPTAKAEGVGG